MNKLIAACLILTAFSYRIPVAAAETGPIAIGYALDLSGKAAFIGQQSQAGAELAKRELAAAGVNVRIVYEDHRTDAKSSVAAVKKLLDVDGVAAVLCDTTPACVAASPAVAAAKKPFMYQAPATSILSGNPYAFKNFLDYEDGCKRVAEYWKTHGIARVGNLKVNMEFGELCAKATREIFPDEVDLPYDTGNDLRALVTRAKGDNLQAAFQTGYEADYISRLRSSSSLGIVLPIGMPEPLLTAAVIAAVAPADLEGTVTFGFQPLDEGFIARLKAAGLYRSGSNLQSAAIAYQHVKELAAAIGACAGEIDCEMRNLEAAPADATLGFEGWKGRMAQYQYRLRVWKGGELRDAEQK